MYILWTMVKLCLLMASNFGYWEAARRKWNMNVYLLPAVTIGAQFCVMFAAGLLNYLGEAAELMYCGGLILLLWQLYREKGRFWKLLRPYCSCGRESDGALLPALRWQKKAPKFCRELRGPFYHFSQFRR